MLGTSSSSSGPAVHHNTGSPGVYPLIYAIVARDRTILSEFAVCVGNFATITRILLEKIPVSGGERKSYTYDASHVFHYITSSGGLTYICLADSNLGQGVAMQFLDQVCGRFESSYLSVSRRAVALQMNAEFQPVLRALMEKVNAGSMDRIQSHIANISDSMIDNIDKIMQRQEKIELLVEKTQTLNETALQFRRQAVDVRRILWWRDARAKITMLLISLVLVFFIVMWICGGIQFEKCTA